jgi:hypothetical protein
LNATACIDRSIGETAPETHNVFLTRQRLSTIDKIDVLFMIDNSLSMGDKQQVLSAAVPQLLKRLTSPDCINTKDKSAEPVAMTDPNVDCPAGHQREFAPVKDIHVGVITSSLGDFGGNTCETTTNKDGSPDTKRPFLQGRDDKAWLLGSLPRTQGAFNAPFLSWTPNDANDFSKRIGVVEGQFRDFVTATGEHGCGQEMSLESWYRFLVDPEPPVSVDIEVRADNTGVTVRNPKVDETLLAQRKQFLRPDSLLAIVMLTDENDCSLKDTGLSWLVTRKDITRKGASAACQKSPNDPCCYSCDLNNPPAGCNVEPNCTGPNPTKDVPNLVCFDQKRRYGYDFLFPTSRYVNALRMPTICPYQNYGSLDCECKEEKQRGITDCVPGKSFKNPIFDPDYAGVTSLEGRTGPDLVFLAGIVGVPWQDVAEPDTLGAGKNLRYQTSSRIDWDLILPKADGTKARDPLMHEQIEPRSGTHPITNEPIGLPTSANQRQLNSINWHDWEGDGKEPQYACVFDLSQPLSASMQSGARDCDAKCASDDYECLERMDGCPCTNSEGNPDKPAIYPKSPLCQASDGSYGKMQYAAKAFPGIRELEVLKGHNTTVADNSIVASICPKDLDWNHRQDRGYGYNPAVQSLVDRLKTKLVSTCLPRPLDAEEGKVPCAVIEAIPPNAQEWANCKAKGRDEVDQTLRHAVLEGMRADKLCDAPNRPACDTFGTCQLKQLTDDLGPNQPLTKCQTTAGYETSSPVPGFCYVDPSNAVGAEELVQQCPENRKRVLRIVGNGDDLRAPAPNSWTFVACAGAPFMKAE